MLVARLTEGIRDFWPFRYLGFGVWETRLEFAVESYIYHRSHPNVRFVPKDLMGHTAFLVAILAISLGGVVLLRLFSHTCLVRELLRSVAGLASILMLPICWLYYQKPYPSFEDVDALRPWLYFELVAIAGAVVVYAFVPRFLPAWSVVASLLMHYVLWGWLFLGGPYFWFASFQSVFPAAGLCASIAWFVYISYQRQESIRANTLTLARS